jgi:outer membrane protein TolC
MLPITFQSHLRSAVRCACWLAIAASFLTSPAHAQTAEVAPASGKTVSFREAIDLALQTSDIMGIARISEWRAFQAYQEVRNHYLPQFTVGSGLGYSYGFPLTLEGSAPSVVNFTSSQALFSPQLRQSLKAAKIAWKAQPFDTQDKRNEVILDTSLTYQQLSSVIAKLATLEKARAAAEKAQFITEQRLQEGVDSRLELTRSQLVTARIRLRIAEGESRRDVLRQHLAKLIGVPAAQIAVDGATIPQPPLILQEDDYAARAIANSPTVQLAEQKALAADASAKAEHKANLPTADLASQYAYLAKFNNYDLYYRRYTANNLSAGLSVRFPFLDYVQKAKAQQADADATVAHKNADMTRNQIAENALKLQRSIRQLEAARDVAKLDWQVSRGEADAAAVRLQTGGANSRDVQLSELEANDKYAVYLDSEYELSRASLQLLRITGELENWALPSR